MNLKQFLFIIYFVAYASCSNVIAADVANKTRELTGLQTRIKKVNRKLNELKTKKNTLISELKKLDIQYGKSIVFLKQSYINRYISLNNEQEKPRQVKIFIFIS